MATTTDTSPATLLSNLTASLKSALDVVPEPPALEGPEKGVSLFDTKTELFLSYIQNLVFLIILKLRQNSTHSGNGEDLQGLNDQVVETLAELRLYLGKGV